MCVIDTCVNNRNGDIFNRLMRSSSLRHSGQRGDVVFVELPEIGKTVAKGDEFAVVESVKAASEVFSPVSGEITDANSVLNDTPETVNASAEGDGWFVKIKLSDASELEGLMDADAYKAHVDAQ